MRRIFAQILFAAPRVALNRTLSNAAHNSSLDGIYVSKKALKTTLALGAVLTGGLLYLERENADRKKVRLLLERSRLSLEKGDFEQFQKEREKAYVFLKQKLPEDKSVIALAMAIGASYEKTDEFAKALLFYSEALENVKLEKRILQCENLRILLLDRLGQCCKNIGNTDSAEKHFENAVKVYEQLKAELSLASESEYDTSALAKLDKSILNVLLHYVVLLLRGQVAKIDCQVEDHIALEKIRMEQIDRRQSILSWFSMWCEEFSHRPCDLLRPSISVRSYVKICILDQATTRGFDNLCVASIVRGARACEAHALVRDWMCERQLLSIYCICSRSWWVLPVTGFSFTIVNFCSSSLLNPLASTALDCTKYSVTDQRELDGLTLRFLITC
ncbi:Tetratricopeptide TPR2 [Plasmopara halstedii]|uniref:Tetratricopeptide TPR2 n=1 Tax=Plasmopara halstedii TaxID=4781 RepID=A0A0P1AFW4_PLAHL|nr:Tetratricopeptide TPR2 [Plasmopara halstedii]CEG39334.1 Tetratricopeptide TPR2 [Plasmopara halstedii]|eukprot:XP_024575703.1 Tetratricopeptide TPR2 [Plasmopara halstedii]